MSTYVDTVLKPRTQNIGTLGFSVDSLCYTMRQPDFRFKIVFTNSTNKDVSVTSHFKFKDGVDVKIEPAIAKAVGSRDNFRDIGIGTNMQFISNRSI